MDLSLLPVGPVTALPLVAWALLGGELLLATIFDLRSRRLPNWLSVNLLAAGLVARGLAAGPWPALWGLAAAALVFALLLLPFHRRWLGAGDVKLAIAVGAWLGPVLILYALLASAILGGALSLLWFLRSPGELRREVRDNLVSSALQSAMPEVGPRPPRSSPPLAPAIALGTALVVLLFARRLLP